jgi:hypothetical protein
MKPVLCDWGSTMRRELVLRISLHSLAAAMLWTQAALAQTNAGAEVDVRASGAKGDGSVDDAPAFAKAIASATKGATIRVPCGVYRLDRTIDIPHPGVIIRGHGYCSTLRINHGADAIVVSAPLFRIADLEVQVAAAAPRNGAGIVRARAGQGYVGNLRLTGNPRSADNGYAFLMDSDESDLWHFDHVRIAGGAVWSSIWRATLSRGTIASTFINNCHFVNGVVLRAVIDIDGAIDTFLVTNSDFPTYGGRSVWLQNTVGAGRDFPRYVHFTNVSVEAGLGASPPKPATALDVATGFDFQFAAGYVASARVGVSLGKVRYAKIVGTHFVNFTETAVSVSGNAADVTLVGNSLVGASQGGAGQFDTVAIGAGANSVTLLGNTFDSLATKPRYHINLARGETDRYELIANLGGSIPPAAGFLRNDAEGSHRTIWGNAGVGNVVSGDETTFDSPVTFNPGAGLVAKSGIQVGTESKPPPCDADHRGLIWLARGAAGVKDSAQICAKDARDAYAWRSFY